MLQWNVSCCSGMCHVAVYYVILPRNASSCSVLRHVAVECVMLQWDVCVPKSHRSIERRLRVCV